MFPLKGWNAELASVYALLYQPMSTSELNSDVMGGVTVETMAISKNTRKYAVTTAARIAASLKPCGHGCSGAAAAGAGAGGGVAAVTVSVSVLSFVVVPFAEPGFECTSLDSFSLSRAIAAFFSDSILADTLITLVVSCARRSAIAKQRENGPDSLVKKEIQFSTPKKKGRMKTTKMRKQGSIYFRN